MSEYPIATSSDSGVTAKRNESYFHKVSVVHINTPESFYVQFYKTQSKLSNLTSDITNFLKLSTSAVLEPQLNNIYAVKYETKEISEWSRAKVIDISLSSEENTEDFNIEVLFIDFGNTQRVKKESLRELPQDIISVEPFAQHCKLSDIYPRNNFWENDAIILMTKILTSNEVLMYYKNFSDNFILEVDLLVFIDGAEFSSLRDFLLYSGYGILHIPIDNTELMPFKNYEITLDKKEKKIKAGDVQSVLISHVVNPEQLYVQIRDCIPELENLEKKMIMYYKHRKCIRNPKKGMKVVILIKDKFCRAEIIDVDCEGSMIQVFCVDYGKTVTVPRRNVLKLHLQFTHLDCQAILVKLADITWIDNFSKWQSTANEFLEKFIDSKEVLRMVVVTTEPKPISVVLFNGTDACINDQLAENINAKSTEIVSEKLKSDEINSEMQMMNIQDEVAYIYAELPPLTVGSEIKITLIRVIDYNQTIIEIGNDSVDASVFVEISQEIQEFANRQPVIACPAVGQPCVALYSEDCVWCRAQIESIIDEMSVNVWFVDFGNMEIVSRQNIRQIKESWMRYPLLQYPANIANIRLTDNSLAEKVVNFLETFIFTVQIVRIESIEPIEFTFIDEKIRNLLHDSLVVTGVLELT